MADCWTSANSRTFGERTKCVSDKHAQYIAVDDEVRVNGELTLSENLARLGAGLWVAYRSTDFPGSNVFSSPMPSSGAVPSSPNCCGRWLPTIRMLPEIRVNGVVANMRRHLVARMANRWGERMRAECGEKGCCQHETWVTTMPRSRNPVRVKPITTYLRSVGCDLCTDAIWSLMPPSSS